MKKNIMLSLAFAFAIVGVSPVVGATQPDENNEHKVTICHRTNSASNPYVKITVDEAAADGVAGNSGQEPDHFGEHKGPLASSEELAKQLKKSKQKWGDIIPPVEPHHDGLNWTAEGQAIYRNGCNYVTPEEPVTPETPGSPLTPSSEETAEAQVEAPASGVKAGSGDITAAVPAALAFFGSIGTLAYGLVRFGKFGA